MLPGLSLSRSPLEGLRIVRFHEAGVPGLDDVLQRDEAVRPAASQGDDWRVLLLWKPIVDEMEGAPVAGLFLERKGDARGAGAVRPLHRQQARRLERNDPGGLRIPPAEVERPADASFPGGLS